MGDEESPPAVEESTPADSAPEESTPAEKAPEETTVVEEAAPEESSPPPQETEAAEGEIDLTSSEHSKHEDDEDQLINLDGERDEDLKNELIPEEGEEAPGEKPPAKQKLSIDETEQIKEEVRTENIDMDVVMESIEDPDIAENIFGEPRGELGPAIDLSGSESSVEEEEERTSEIISFLAEFGLHPYKEPIDRAAYEEEYKTLKATAVTIRRKNGLLHKKIGEYYKKRKMNRVFEDIEIDQYEGLLDKYEQKVFDLYEYIQRTNREKEAVDNEMSDMRNLRDEQKEELNKFFTEMQEREFEIGHGLIDSGTGKSISDKVIERLLSRQKAKSDEIAVIRLNFIKRRDKVKEIDNKIKSLETIGGTLHLMDFEQLRMENQTFSDKIEERDEELMRLRGRYSHAMQALAHIREKLNIIQVQIEDLHEKKISEEANVNRTREILNALKIQRDSNRAQRAKLKSTTGILTYPKILLDMEMEMNHTEKLRGQLENLKATNKEERQKLQNIRTIIEKTEHVREKRIKKSRIAKGGRGYLYSRPTLSYPIDTQIALFKSRINEIPDID